MKGLSSHKGKNRSKRFIMKVPRTATCGKTPGSAMITGGPLDAPAEKQQGVVGWTKMQEWSKPGR